MTGGATTFPTAYGAIDTATLLHAFECGPARLLSAAAAPTPRLAIGRLWCGRGP